MNRLKMSILSSIFVTVLIALFLTAGVVQAASSSGGTWSVVSSPNVASNNNVLNAVSAVSTSDVWATGYNYPSSGGGQTLAEHWNGSAWSIVTSSGPGSSYNILYGVTRVPGTNHEWTVGYFVNGNNGLFQTLTEYKL